MASKQEKTKANICLRVMHLISQKPKMLMCQIADKAGIPNRSAYYVVATLTENGFIKLSNLKLNLKKGQYAYILTRKGFQKVSLLIHRLIKVTEKKFIEMKSEIEARGKAGLKTKYISSTRGSRL